jgi:hypothetical protein
MKMNRKCVITISLVVLCASVVYLSIYIFQKANDKQREIETKLEIKTQLENRLELWREYIQENLYSSDFTDNKHYREIIKLGIPASPYLIEKIEEGVGALGDAITIITKKRFEKYEQPEYIVWDSKSTATAVVKWWPKARKETPQKFRKLYTEWKNLKNQGKEKEKEEKEKLEQIRALGIAALPMIIEKVRKGDKELIPIVSKLTNDQVDPNTSISKCFAWWRDNKQQWLIPFPNKRPVAKAGKDKTATSGDAVQLDGSASSDEDKDELTYTWTQKAGPHVKLSDETGVNPTFTAPEVKVSTVLTFELKVNDAGDVFKSCPTPDSESKPDTIKITVNPK